MKAYGLLLLLITFSLFTNAQLCTGSLGDPVVHISFGSGNNPGGQLSAASTTYRYISSDCPDDGSYTVRNSTANCFGSTWQNISADHTPNDVNGYFMLVNASFQPGDFYVDTVRQLCARTTYEFSAWIMNVLRPSACQFAGIDPNLTFKIETTNGTVLATYNTGNIPEVGTTAWQQYGLFFTTPANASTVVVRITNNAPGGCGNDIALDDITFRPCGPKVTAAIDQSGDTTLNICQGNQSSFLLNSIYSQGYDNPVMQWQLSINNGMSWTDIPGATQPTYLRLPTGPGTYQYRLSIAESGNINSLNCRVGSNLISIYVNNLPTIQITDETQSCLGTDVSLEASGAATYQWTGPNGFNSTSAKVLLTDVDMQDAGRYRVIAVSDKGCTTQDSTDLFVNPVPTAGVSARDHICEGESSQITATGGIDYTWSPAAGLSSTTIFNPLATPTDTTTYMVKVFNQFSCADSIRITINVWKKPKANAGPDKQTREGIPVLLQGSVTGTDINYSWSPSSFLNRTDILQPTATLLEDMVYTLTAVSNLGCGLHSDEVRVKVYKNVKVPNAFSPNGDGINDRWEINGLITYPDAELRVFNRYGQQVHQSKGYSSAWDGRYKGLLLPTGTYYYVIDLKIGDPIIGGWVFLIR